ncbi:endonuclease [Pseudooceanicola sediminis]|mgnify:CR=1 FL=1|uniref:Endonuclease n=1 Tax=Pseudooceanicola sediminis TaxID=2211117 RepID=A0A399J648_9RHOB|nr:endonuclease/exonuclease/phosphatase family protein [Pseudooceanicola sediminis]KAA2316895.1 endonuclease [Puniceibacterium sp. HSS470]RII40650.1 endonuclease [Pseudooceanicola sediminis]|tara:strand:+ start:103162 stop:103869 length:708 start_codon:yes stop_codon:yes gene_type:complete
MKTPSLRIATYNLQKCVGMDLRRNPRRSLEVLEETGAVLCVLQEADKRLPPRPAALPHDMVTAERWQILQFGAPGGSLGWHGNAMLLRGDVIEVVETDQIDLPGLEPRGAIRADLETAIGPLRVVGVHLGLIARSRRQQCAALRRMMERLPPRPTVVAGDFNEWGSGADLNAELAPLRLLHSPPSYPAIRPIAALDRFSISPDLTAGPVRPHLAQPARIASDHLPITVEISPRAQ